MEKKTASVVKFKFRYMYISAYQSCQYLTTYKHVSICVCFCFLLMFNATFNNISVISQRSVLLVEETEIPEKTTDLSHNVLLNSQL